MAKNILVTGGAGNLGNYVSPYLTEKGYNVTNFDSAQQKPESPNMKAGIPFVQGNLLSLGDCMRAVAHAEPDVIVHLGAIPFNTEIQPAYGREYNRATDGARFVQRMNEDETMSVNTMGTYYMLDAARRLGVKEVIAASSYFALGIGFRISGKSFEPEYLPIDEEHPCTPEDTYSLSKLLNEETMKAFSRAYGMKCVAMRLLGVFYENNEFSKKMYKFNVSVPEPKPDEVDMLVSNTYQFADARDIARFVELAINAKNLGPFEAFYIATDTVYTDDTVDVIKRRWPSLAKKGFGMDIKGTEGIISIGKARKLVGYEPQFSWRNV